VKVGLQIPDFTRPESPSSLGPALRDVARTADDAGFDFIAVMDSPILTASP
jgi:alkanesulfonate monooxygenase SsuD/methylene tetrahydromethanopterin reductase-like flavin-dependent oxidoreductase (luciferase family)